MSLTALEGLTVVQLPSVLLNAERERQVFSQIGVTNLFLKLVPIQLETYELITCFVFL